MTDNVTVTGTGNAPEEQIETCPNLLGRRIK
jgi:hypothetical protein